MSTFETLIVRINRIDPIPDADLIAVGYVGLYQVVIKKSDFNEGDLGVYLPEDSLVPEYIQVGMGLVGRLAGPNHSRIKAVRLRKVLSQGLLVPLRLIDPIIANTFIDGMDVQELIGVKKYEPELPTKMRGEVVYIKSHLKQFDIDNVKKYPDIIVNGETVEFTEKLHGTLGCIARHRSMVNEELPGNGFYSANSKGLGNQGLAFKGNEANVDNLYVKNLYTNIEKLDQLYQNLAFDYNDPEAVYVFGEIYGPVQDLKYGLTEPAFSVFDIFVGNPVTGRYLNFEERNRHAKEAGFNVVPSIYTGPFSHEVLEQHTSGLTVAGNGAHIREGIVVRLLDERHDRKIGRIILKSVSADYLLRKDKDATEFT